MPADNTGLLPIVQMGYVEKAAETALNSPVVQQHIAQETAAKELKEQNSQVPKTDGAEKGKRVRDRQTGGNARDRSRPKDRPPEEQAEESPPTNADNPWAGHIVNLKI